MNTLTQITILSILWLVVMGCVSGDDTVFNHEPPTDVVSSEPTVQLTTLAATVTPEPTATPEPTQTPDANSQVSDNSTDIDIRMPLPIGDPQNGEEVLLAKACFGCHLIDAIGAGPSWKADNYANGVGIAQRAQERWQQPEYTGQATNATEYLVESILLPNDYVIEGYMNSTMPSAFRDILTDQELADIVAYLLEIE